MPETDATGLQGDGASDAAAMGDAVRVFLQRRNDPDRVRGLRESLPGFDPAFWQELAALGCTGALVSEQHGGLGLGIREMAAICREAGAALLPEPLTAVAVGAARILADAGNQALAGTLLPQLAGGELLVGLAWQEAGGASPLERPATVASPQAGGLVLNGAKRFVVPAAGADGYLVTAALGEGVTICWVPAAAPGLSLTIEWRADGTASGLLRLENVAVPEDCIVAGPGIACDLLRAALDECCVCIAAELLGAAETMLETTLDYLRVREQFGRPIGSFQALQHRAVDLYVQQELARAALEEAVETLAGDTAGAPARAIAASRAKARCADAALAIGREAVQMHGAMGFTDECDVGLYLKRSLVLAAWLGNAALHRRRIGELSDVSTGAPETLQPSGRPLRQGPDGDAPVDWNGLADEDFRLAVRHIFETEYPPELRYPPRRLRWQECRDFYVRLGQKGLLALSWPKEFGGAGLSPQKQLIFMAEQDRWGVARAPDMGITMVGPGLIRYGSPAQRERFLPSILAFDHMWCQGFSEPNAGSDLASLRTEAVRDGDDFVINGSKIWTTFAQDATHMFILVRTDKSGRKQFGISVLLLDLKTPGITVRPIRDLAGNEEFCEVHFADVRVPADNLLGPLDQGWTVAKTLLAHERIYLGNPRQAQYALQRLEQLASELGLHSAPDFAARLMRLKLDVLDLTCLYRRFADAVRRGEALGPEVSILKIFGSETYQRLADLAIESIGDCGGLWGEVPIGNARQNVMSLFMNARPSTIYGGSSEVQRNIIGKEVLRLPVR